MKLIDTKDAVGHILCHDITQIIPGVTKDAAFRKGHIVREEDIPVLLSMGKDHLYIWEKGETRLHENEAAEILRAMCQNQWMEPTPVKEGKIDLIAQCDGLLLVDVERLRKVNELGEMMIATRASGIPVKKGEKLAGTRIIPLVIEQEKMEHARQVAGDAPLLTLIPFKPKKAGVITTGNEVFHGRIQDSFTPVIERKLAEYGSVMTEHVILDDDHTKITQAIHDMHAAGVDLIICTGGMSVDPDDKTPLAIRNSGANIISYGAPVLPGAMFLLSYLPSGVPVMGLPGCVMYSKRTIFDLVLPLVLAEQPVSQEQLAALGHGGLCMDCPVCIWPNCGFGKGV